MERRKVIAALLLDYLQGEYQLGLIQGVEEATREWGGNLLVVVGRSLHGPEVLEPAHNQIFAQIGAASVDGVILGSGSLGSYVGLSSLSAFARRLSGLPMCSVSAELPDVPSLVISNQRATRTLVDHLIEVHGCRRIAYIRGPLENDEANERYAGYVESLRAHGLALDPELVEVGDFWIHKGAAGASRLLDRNLRFDALVAANDYMAFGACDALKARGVRLPHDVVVAGFDDIPLAQTNSPSLTTVRQPMQAMGRAAAESIFRQLRGERVPLRQELDVQLMRRQSCGCGYREPRRRSGLARPAALGPTRSVALELERSADQIHARIEAALRLPRATSDRLLRALSDELSETPGRFLHEFQSILDEEPPPSVTAEEFHLVIGALRSHFHELSLEPREAALLEDLWYAALLLIGSASNRSYLRRKIVAQDTQDGLRKHLDRLSTSLSHATLTEILRELLPAAAIRSAAISLYEDEARQTMRSLFVLGAGSELDGKAIPSSRLAPPGFFPSDRPWTYLVLPLTFDAEQLGVGLFEAGGHQSIYRQLQGNISAAVKGAALHRTIVQEMSLRKRAEHEQLEKEARIARLIQTEILPSALRVEGLELAALMLPAAEVGGDYYDVLPVPGGCWIGIGDVVGHGLLAGLLMLMIQSMTAGIVHLKPDASPSEAVIALNAALFKNIRDRLKRDEHATLTLIKYERDGRLTFAGCHEEMLIFRARSRRCEWVSTPGVWTAAVADVSQLTQDAEARLEDQDLLVLYSDGVIEAMNSRREQFGSDRLARLVEEHQARPAAEICAAVVRAVTAWEASQRDDVTILVGRFTAPHVASAEELSSS